MLNPDNFASVPQDNSQCNQSWFNQYGGHIIETTWDNASKKYVVKQHMFNYPRLGMFDNE
jgi:hypothetical protein